MKQERTQAAAADPGPETAAAVKSEPAADGEETPKTPRQPAPEAKRRKRTRRDTVQAELDAARDRLLRLQADFENFRKRTVREKEALYTRSNEDLIQELLPVLDHFELAVGACRDHDVEEAIVEGFALVSEQLRAALAKFGLAAIDAEGGTFDPEMHEAVSHLPSEDVPENGIMVQVRRGYRLANHLLRAAQVVVSSGPADGAGQGPEATQDSGED